MTEQDTFNRLRRRDIDLVYGDLGDFMRRVMHRDSLKEINTSHPEIKHWLDNEGYSPKELQDYLRSRSEERRKIVEQMERDGVFG